MEPNKKSKIDKLLDDPEETGTCSEGEPCADPEFEMPSIGKQAKSFGSELLKNTHSWIKGKKVIVDMKIYNERIKTCQSCEYAVRTLKKLRCKQCGCFMDIKARLTSAKCPIDKWKV